MRRRNYSLNRQRGFSLITAVFIVVILSAIAAFMVVTSSRSQLQPQQAQLAANTYQAARAGLEWGIYQAIVNGDVDPNACNSGGGFSPAGLANYTVTVTCTSSIHRDGGGGTDVRIFVVESVATTGTPGGLAFANRRMRATVSPSGPL